MSTNYLFLNEWSYFGGSNSFLSFLSFFLIFFFHLKGRFLEFRGYFWQIYFLSCWKELLVVGKNFLQRNKQVSVKCIELKALD